MGVIDKTPRIGNDVSEDGLYTFKSPPNVPGERGGNLLVKFQAVSRIRQTFTHHYISVSSKTSLSTVRRHINKFFKDYFERGFIFLSKTKEILKSDEKGTTVFDILPKIPQIGRDQNRKFVQPNERFLFPDVDYKEVPHHYDGKRYMVVCACVIFLYERSTVSHWSPNDLHTQLSENLMDGFAFIPADIMSWKPNLMVFRPIDLHINAAIGNQKKLLKAIKKLPGGTPQVSDILDERNATPLHYASENIPIKKCENGNLDVCEILVNSIGRDQIYRPDINGKTPLHCALYRKRKEIIPYLLQLNSDMYVKDIYGNDCLTLLYLQSESDLEYITSQLQMDCLDKRIQFAMCYTMLRKKNEKAGLELCKCMPDYKEFDQDVTNIGCSLLHISALFSYQISEMLINRGFSRMAKDVVGLLPFHRACYLPNINHMKLLYDSEMNDSDIWVGIRIALKNRHYEQCAEIVRLRPDLSMDETTTCMLIEVLNSAFHSLRQNRKSKQKVEIIAGHILPILLKEEGSSEQFLFDCAYYGLDSTLVQMKSLGVDFNQIDFMGRSPLHEASQQNNTECVKVLLKGGANPNALDWRNASPLHYAAEKGNTSVIKLLVDGKGQLGLQEDSGRTPLLSAIHRGKSEVTRFLLQSHVDLCNLHATDKLNQSVIHYLPFIDNDLQEIVLKHLKISQPQKSLKPNPAKTPLVTTVWSETIKETIYSSPFRNTEFDKKSKPFQNRHEAMLWKTRYQAFDISIRPKEIKVVKQLLQCGKCFQVFKQEESHICKTDESPKGGNTTITLKPFEFHEYVCLASNNPLQNAIRARNMHTAKLLLKYDPNLLQSTDEVGRSPFEYAIQQGSVKVLKSVLDMTKETRNKTCIHYILMHESQIGGTVSSDMLKLLLSVDFAHSEIPEPTTITHQNCEHHGKLSSSSCDFKRCHLKSYLPIEASVIIQNSSIFHTLLEKIKARNLGIAVHLAVYYGNSRFLESLCKKKLKDTENDPEMQKIENLYLLDIACRSPHASEMVMATLIKYYPDILHSNQIFSCDDISEFRPFVSKDMKLGNLSEQTPLGKLLSPSHMLMENKFSAERRSFIDRIGVQLVDMGIYLGKYCKKDDNEKLCGEVHGICEALFVALVSNHFSTAIHMLRASGRIIWECAFSKSQCDFQKNLDKWLCDTPDQEIPSFITKRNTDEYISRQRQNNEKSLGFIKYILLLASSNHVPSDVLKNLLEAGRAFSDSYKNASEEIKLLEIQEEDIREKVFQKRDPVEKTVLCVLHIIAKYPLLNKFYLRLFLDRTIEKTSFLKLLQCAPIAFPFLQNYSVGLFDCRQIDSQVEINLMRSCLRLMCNENNDGSAWFPKKTSLLHIACCTNNVDFVRILLEAPLPVSVLDKNEKGIRPLDLAAVYGSWEIVKYLLEKGAKYSSATIVACCSNDSHLGIDTWAKPIRMMCNAETPSPKAKKRILKELLQRKNMDLKFYDESRGGALHNAIRNQLDEVILYLMELDPSLLYSALNNQSVLAEDLQKCQESTVLQAYNHVSRQMDHLQSRAKGQLLLHGLSTGRKEIVESFTKALQRSLAQDNWIEILKETDKHGRTAFHFIAISGFENVALQLTKHIYEDQSDFPLDIIDFSGASPLWYALAFKNWKVAEIYLWSGASPILKRSVPGLFPKRQFQVQISEDMQNGCVKHHSERSDSSATAACLTPVHESLDSSQKNLTQTKCRQKIADNFDSSPKYSFPRTSHRSLLYGFENKSSSRKIQIKAVERLFYGFKKTSSPRKIQIKAVKLIKTKDESRVRKLIRKSYTSKMLGLSLVHFATRTGDADLLRNITSISNERLLRCNEFTESAFMHSVLGGNKKILSIFHENGFLEFPSKSFLLSLICLATTRFLSRWSVRQSLVRLIEFIHDRANGLSGDSSVTQKKKLPIQKCLSGDDFRLYLDTMKQVLEENSIEASTINHIESLITFVYEMVYNLENKRRLVFGSLEQMKNDRTVEYIQENVSTFLKKTSQEDSVNERDIFLLLMLNQRWAISCINDAARSNQYLLQMLKKPILWDLNALDLITIIMPGNHGRNEAPTSQQQDLIPEIDFLTKHVNLNLKETVVALAFKRNLWIVLKQVVTNISQNESEKPCWEKALAASMKGGEEEFMRTIIDQVSVPRLPEVAQAKYTAYLCVAALNGRTGVVKYLLRHNVPVKVDTKNPAFVELLGNGYIEKWDILQYAIKSNKSDTVDAVIKFCKHDREYMRSADHVAIFDLAARNGSWQIMKYLCDLFIKDPPTATKWEGYLIAAAARGHEDFCLHLVTKETDIDFLCVDSSNRNILHYCGRVGMSKLADEMLNTSRRGLDQSDSDGMKPIDYATLFGSIEVSNIFYQRNGMISKIKIDTLETYGWFRFHLKQMHIQRNSNESNTLRPCIPKDRTLGIRNLLKRGDDVTASNVVRCSKHIKQTLLENSEEGKLLHDCIKYGCIDTFHQILSYFEDDLQSILKYEDQLNQYLTPLAAAIVYCRISLVEYLFQHTSGLNWRSPVTGESVLHLAVKTGNASLIRLVNMKTNGELLSEKDNFNNTPFVYLVALGLQNLSSFLKNETQLIVNEAHVTHTKDDPEFTCVGCILDRAIGWSKMFLGKCGSDNFESIRQIDKTRNPTLLRDFFWKYGHGKDHPVYSTILMSLGYNPSHLSVLKVIMSHEKLQKMVLTNGFVDILDEYGDDSEILVNILGLAIIQNVESVFLKLVEYIQPLDLHWTRKFGVSVFETVIGYDRLDILSHLIKNSNIDEEEFSTFKAIQSTLPQKQLWLSNLEQIGGEDWHHFQRTDNHSPRLLKADLWVVKSLAFPVDLKLNVESKSKEGEIVPSNVNGKKYTVDLDSFKKSNCFSDPTDIWLQCVLTSTAIFGSIEEFTATDESKIRAASAVKVSCLPSSSTDHAKVSIDNSGVILDQVRISSENGVVFVQQDRSLCQRPIETMLKEQILQDIIPHFNSILREWFGLNISVRVDWNSIELRKRTWNMESVLKSINGELFGNKLGGLEDVLNHCWDMKNDIESMFNRETFQIALEPLENLREITVTFDDKISHSDQNLRRISDAKQTLWHFTISQSRLCYDRSQLPLWRHLTMFHAVCSSLCGSIHSIANIPTHYGEIRHNTGSLTFEIDLQSFGVGEASVLRHLICEDVAREIMAIAYDCQSALRLEKRSTRIVLKSTISLQHTGISFKEETATVHISCNEISNKEWSVDRSNSYARLTEAEDQQLMSLWTSDILDGVRKKAEEVKSKLLEGFGMNIYFQIDDKRLVRSCLGSCRREYGDPFTIIEKSVSATLTLFERAYRDVLESLIYSEKGTVTKKIHALNAESGLWNYETTNSNRKMSAGDIIVEIDPNNLKSLTPSSAPVYKTYRCSRKTTFSACDPNLKMSTNKVFLGYLKRRLVTENNQTETSPDLVTLENHVFRVVEAEYVDDVLQHVPLKNNINQDITKSLEYGAFYDIRDKLLPVKTSAKFPSPDIFLLMHLTETEIKKFLPIKEISVDWRSFMQDNNNKNVKRFTNCIQSLIDSLWELFPNGLECVTIQKVRHCLCRMFSSVHKLHICMQNNREVEKEDIERSLSGGKISNPSIMILKSGEVRFIFSPDLIVKPFPSLLYQASVLLAERNIKSLLECELQNQSKSLDQNSPHGYRPDNVLTNSICRPEYTKVLEQYDDICLIIKCLKTHVQSFIPIVQQSVDDVVFIGSDQTTVSMKETTMVFGISDKQISKHDLAENLMKELGIIGIRLKIFPDFQLHLPPYYDSNSKCVIVTLSAVNVFGENTEEFLHSISSSADFKVKLLNATNTDTEIINPDSVEIIEQDKIAATISISIDEIKNKKLSFLIIIYKDEEIQNCDIPIFSQILSDQPHANYHDSVSLKKDENIYILLRHDNCRNVSSDVKKSQSEVRFVQTKSGVEFEAFFRRMSFPSSVSHVPFALSKAMFSKDFHIFRVKVLDAKRQFRMRATCMCCRRQLSILSSFGTVKSNQDLVVNKKEV